jgi:hypothetical protein
VGLVEQLMFGEKYSKYGIRCGRCKLPQQTGTCQACLLHYFQSVYFTAFIRITHTLLTLEYASTRKKLAKCQADFQNGTF